MPLNTGRTDSALTPEQNERLRQLDISLSHVHDMLENDTPRAGDFLEQIIDDIRDHSHDEFQRRYAYALLLSSRLHYRHMQFNKAVTLGAESLAIYELLKDIAGQHEANYLLGIYHIRFNDNVQALDYLMKAVDFAEQVGDVVGLGSASMILAVVFRNMEQYDRSLKQLGYALQMKQKSQDVYGEAVVYSNMARTYAKMKKVDKAIDFARRSIATAKHRQSEYLLVNSELVLGDVYAQAERHEEALEQFERCLTICRKHEWLELEVATVSKIGTAYLGVGEVDQAIDVLLTGLETSQAHLSTYITLDILEVLVQAYEANGDYEQAYINLKGLHKLQKEQIEAERSERLRALETSYQMRAARQEAQTQQQRAEEIAQRAQQDREYFLELNRIRDEFLSAATHDLKNPLASIRTSLYLLRVKVGENDNLKRHINVIDSRVEHMTQVITDMLDIAKLETGRALDKQPTPIYDLVNSVVAEYQSVADERNIQLFCDCQFKDEDIALDVDVSLFKRAIGNLLSNAVKYSNENCSVRTSIFQQDEAIHIAITDHGIGIEPHDIPHIFDRFYRVQSSQTQYIEGTGLGLSIVKTIVEQHNGKVLVESEVGKGTTFTIVLPITSTD